MALTTFEGYLLLLPHVGARRRRSSATIFDGAGLRRQKPRTGDKKKPGERIPEVTPVQPALPQTAREALRNHKETWKRQDNLLRQPKPPLARKKFRMDRCNAPVFAHKLRKAPLAWMGVSNTTETISMAKLSLADISLAYVFGTTKPVLRIVT